MQISYQNELYELRKWIDNTNANMNLPIQVLHTPQEIQAVQYRSSVIAEEIQSDYPFYDAMLPRISSILFSTNMLPASLNPAAFGELYAIIRYIEAEPFAMWFWSANGKTI